MLGLGLALRPKYFALLLKPTALSLTLALQPEALALPTKLGLGLELEIRPCYEICDFLQRLCINVQHKIVKIVNAYESLYNGSYAQK